MYACTIFEQQKVFVFIHSLAEIYALMDRFTFANTTIVADVVTFLGVDRVGKRSVGKPELD